MVAFLIGAVQRVVPWGLVTAISLAAGVILDASGVRSGPGSAPREEVGLRFVCAGDVTEGMWRERLPYDRERKPDLPFGEARRKRRPPRPPGIHGAGPLAAGVDPVSGWSETPGSRLLRERTERLSSPQLQKNIEINQLDVYDPSLGYSQDTAIQTEGYER